VCANRRKNQTINAYAGPARNDTNFDKLAWKRLFSVTGDEANFQHTAAGMSRGDQG